MTPNRDGSLHIPSTLNKPQRLTQLIGADTPVIVAGPHRSLKPAHALMADMMYKPMN